MPTLTNGVTCLKPICILYDKVHLLIRFLEGGDINVPYGFSMDLNSPSPELCGVVIEFDSLNIPLSGFCQIDHGFDPRSQQTFKYGESIVLIDR